MKPKSNDAKPARITTMKRRPATPRETIRLPPTPHIVALGASAGGLEALQQFFNSTPPDSGMAFVVIQHLSPDYKSMMVELLSKNTAMPVKRVENNMPVEPNQVYLIPPKTQLTLLHGKLLLGEIDHGKGLVLPIDIFFKSLAEDQGERAIGVVLSGTGSDGTRGIRAIKEAGGMVMVQEESSAKFGGMPGSAIATGLADFVLPPERMPEALHKYIQHPYVQKTPDLSSGSPNAEEDQIDRLIVLLRKETGVDFSFYKPSTILRRIERRMGIAQMVTVEEYVRYLSQSPQAVKALYKDLLISVTRFFRDPEAFEILRRKVIPEIFAQASGDQPVRIWVAGCATGEEAYSVAILCAEQMEDSKKSLEVKIFATDLDKEALDHAGRGAYPESIVVDLPDEKLRRYFIKDGNSYCVQRHIRQMVVFAAHNILSDPPFTKISLVTCRNLLIYLQPVLQRRVMTSFRFALYPRGYLFLGSSETIGDLSASFETLSPRHKVFRHRGDLRPILSESMDLTPLQERMSRRSADLSRPFRASRASNREQTVDRITAKLLREHVPACLVVEESGKLVYTYGTPGDFLALPAGQATLNALEMLPRALALVLPSAIHKAQRDHKTLTYRDIRVRGRDRMRSIDMTVEPFRDEDSDAPLYLVFLAEAPLALAAAESESLDLDAKASQRINDLERELQTNKENLQAAIEELETSNEELQATNEELLAANEELQSTNEELQSVNEELYTVNAEYQNKIDELADLNNDMNNLLTSTQIGKLFLDLDLRIRKFTQPITQEIDLLPHDIGRPVGDFAHPFMQAVHRDAIKVIKTHNVFDQLMKSATGRWYLLRLVPYRTQQAEVFGVIAALVEVTALKESQLAARKGELAAAVTLNTLAAGVCAINEQGRIILVNEAFEQRLGRAKSPLSGTHFTALLAEPGQTPLAWPQIRHNPQPSGIIPLWASDGTSYSARLQTRAAGETTIWVATLID